MVVDDSAITRGLISRWLESDPGVVVAGTAGTGAQAIRSLRSVNPEVVLLDIEMPEMDGMTALPKILALMPEVRVVMASTLTRRNADISMRALEIGASDYVPKPESTRDPAANQAFRDELLEKVKTIGERARHGRPKTAAARPALPVDLPARPAAPTAPAGPLVRAAPPALSAAMANVRLRPASRSKPAVLAIGSSTGGPQALFKLIAFLKDHIAHLPVIITQHMPATFTSILAEHLSRVSGRACSEARDGETLEAGHIYIAPGDYHMTVQRDGTRVVLHTDQEAPENFCRPAVDPMFRSVAHVFGPQALCVVLTGMGSDGRNGGRDVAAAGGTILAQDEETSVVWGMPGAVANDGLCSAILPLQDIGPAVQRMIIGGAL